MMRIMRHVWVLSALAWGCRAAVDSSAAPQYGPNDIEIRLRDGSLLRGEISSTAPIELKTAYGNLTFPLSRILRIKTGFRLAKEKEGEIRTAIKELDSDDFTTRGQAQHALEEFGAQAVDILKDARTKASAEARSRIEAILKKVSGTSVHLSTDDLVKSDEFEAAGTLQFDVFNIHCHIGDLKVKLEDLESVRWLGAGATKLVVVEARASLADWFDTGVDAIYGEKMSVAAAGGINLFGNNAITPEGSNSWGAAPFQTGAVIGKLGANGKPFLIGEGKQWTPENHDRLYVKIFCAENLLNNNNNPSSGEFNLHVATGVWAEEVHVKPAGAVNPQNANPPAQQSEQLMIRD